MEARKRKFSESDGNSQSSGSSCRLSEQNLDILAPELLSESVPSSNNQWKPCEIEGLGIKFSRSSAMDIVYRWSLYTMLRKDVAAEEINALREILNVCNSIPADYASFEELKNKCVESDELYHEFLPTERMPNETGLCWCHFEEFQQKLELVLREIKANPAVCVADSNFQTLFEDFLHICGLITRHQPDIAVKKTKIRGKLVTSSPDMLCYGSEGRVSCVVEVIKKTRHDNLCDIPVVERTQSELFLHEALLAQHTGDLLSYIDSSVTHMDICGSIGRDILGFTVNKTLVTVTLLQLTELSWDKIRNSTKKGPIKHTEKPVLHYTRQYDFVKKTDRRELFKVILHIKLMLSVHDKLLLQRRNKGTVDIFSKKKS